MNKVTIDRELLERIDETAICDGTDATAPRQPEEVNK